MMCHHSMFNISNKYVYLQCADHALSTYKMSTNQRTITVYHIDHPIDFIYIIIRSRHKQNRKKIIYFFKVKHEEKKRVYIYQTGIILL